MLEVKIYYVIKLHTTNVERLLFIHRNNVGYFQRRSISFNCCKQTIYSSKFTCNSLISHIQKSITLILQVCGVNLSLKLKTENWLSQVEREIELCTTNCVQLCEYIDVSANSDYNSLGIPIVPSSENKSNKPSRPPLPKSPNAAPKHPHRHQAGVISINRPKPPNIPPPPNVPPPLPDRPNVPNLPNVSNAADQDAGVSKPISPPATQNQNIETNDQSDQVSAIYEEIQDDIVRA